MNSAKRTLPYFGPCRACGRQLSLWRKTGRGAQLPGPQEAERLSNRLEHGCPLPPALEPEHPAGSHLDCPRHVRRMNVLPPYLKASQGMTSRQVNGTRHTEETSWAEIHTAWSSAPTDPLPDGGPYRAITVLVAGSIFATRASETRAQAYPPPTAMSPPNTTIGVIGIEATTASVAGSTRVTTPVSLLITQTLPSSIARNP